MNITTVLRDQRGSATVMFAVFLMACVGLAAIAVDGGHLYSLKSKLQTTADAAVLVAVSELPDTDAARTAAILMAGKNMPTGEHGAVLANADVVTGNWDTGTRTFAPAGTPINAVRVVTRRSQANGNAAPTFFARILGFDSIDIEVSAIAMSGSVMCVLALDPTSAGSFNISNRTYTANNCSIHVNSNDPEAITGNPGGVLDADSICVVGDYDPSPTYYPTPDTGCAPIPDPLASLAAPAVGACTATDYQLTTGDDTIDPGVYCNGIKANTPGTLTLNPGIYIIKDGTFAANGGANITGDGVHIFLTGNTTYLDFAGGGVLTLSAMTTGPMAGILVYADRNMDPLNLHNLKGGGGSTYEGVVYMPSTGLNFTGSSTGTSTSSWASYIARVFHSGGSGELVINFVPGSSSVPLPVGFGRGRLVQ